MSQNAKWTCWTEATARHPSIDPRRAVADAGIENRGEHIFIGSAQSDSSAPTPSLNLASRMVRNVHHRIRLPPFITNSGPRSAWRSYSTAPRSPRPISARYGGPGMAVCRSRNTHPAHRRRPHQTAARHARGCRTLSITRDEGAHRVAGNAMRFRVHLRLRVEIADSLHQIDLHQPSQPPSPVVVRNGRGRRHVFVVGAGAALVVDVAFAFADGVVGDDDCAGLRKHHAAVESVPAKFVRPMPVDDDDPRQFALPMRRLRIRPDRPPLATIMPATVAYVTRSARTPSVRREGVYTLAPSAGRWSGT